MSSEAVYCIDCGTKNMQIATYCRKCGSKLQKDEDFTNKTPVSEQQMIDNKTVINTANTNTSDKHRQYEVGKYLHIGIKGTSPMCSEIISVDHLVNGTMVKLDNNATLLFGPEHDSNYTFIEVLDEPINNKCNLGNNQWNEMNIAQKRLLLCFILCIIIIDILYITAWIINKLNVLSDDISCGITKLYNDKNNEYISYKEICDEYGECDMLNHGEIILICSIIACLLHNILIWFCIFVNIFYSRFFMKSRSHTVILFIGFVVSAILLLFSMSLWDGRGSSVCSDGCTYFNDVVCDQYKNGATQNIFFAIEGLSIACGIFLTAIASSNSFNVT